MRARILTVIVLSSGALHAAPDRRVVVEPAPILAPHADISNVLYLNRCVGGCTIRRGPQTSATEDTSSVLQPGGTCLDPNSGCVIAEFEGNSGQTGAAADADWAALVECVREVYSPYDVRVTDERPASGRFHQAIAAGRPMDIGLPSDVLGIAQLTSNCSPIDDSISFSFANQHDRADEQRIFTMCWTVTQESAHAYGLDHSFEFVNGVSACNDPMTYRTDCGGQRFFRNKAAVCGERSERACRCGATQNSHAKLTSVFGAGGSPLVAAPTAEITLPLPDTAIGAVVGARAGSRRGVATVKLVVNGSVWSAVRGAAFGVNGQANPGIYTLPVPSDLPASKLEVVVRACDDLGTCTDSAAVQSVKGDPAGCTDGSCGANQTCDQGYCRFPPPTGEVGDSCEFSQFCKSELCVGADGARICSQRCDVGDACPADLSCVPTEDNLVEGVCFLENDAGCCSAGAGRGAATTAVAASLLLSARARRRRKKGG